MKQLWLEIIEKIGCWKLVRPSTVRYYMYITRPYIEHHFSQLFLVRVVLSTWTFYKKNLLFGPEKNVIFKIGEQSLWWRSFVQNTSNNLTKWNQSASVWSFRPRDLLITRRVVVIVEYIHVDTLNITHHTLLKY